MGNRRKPKTEDWEKRESRDEKRDSRKPRRDNRDLRSTGPNDEEWYGSDPALLRDAASIAFSWPMGRPAALSKSSGGSDLNFRQSGVCTLFLRPTIGIAGSKDAPINVASASQYSWIRHANSGSKNYDSPDLMIYDLAMSDIYSALNWAIRIYGLATAWTQKNRFLPREVILANGVNADSVINNLANFRMRLNVLINKVAAMAVPATMTFYARRAFLYQNIYSESESIKDVLYQFAPEGFYKFALDNQVRGYLDFQTINTLAGEEGNLTWEGVLKVPETLMQAVWDQEDFGIMSGDILRAYGDNIIKLVSIDENYIVLPVFNEKVLSQFKNATVFGQGGLRHIVQNYNGEGDPSNYSYLTYSDGNASPVLVTDAASALAVTNNKLLTINAADQPTPGEVMEAARLMVTFDSYEGDDFNKVDVNCGTEIAHSCELRIMKEDGTFMTVSNANYTIRSDSARESASHLSLATQFKYAPLIYVYHNEGTAPTAPAYHLADGSYWDVFGNLDNWAVLRSQDIKKLHEAAVLNMLNVPSIAKNAITQR